MGILQFIPIALSWLGSGEQMERLGSPCRLVSSHIVFGPSMALTALEEFNVFQRSMLLQVQYDERLRARYIFRHTESTIGYSTQRFTPWEAIVDQDTLSPGKLRVTFSQENVMQKTTPSNRTLATGKAVKELELSGRLRLPCLIDVSENNGTFTVNFFAVPLVPDGVTSVVIRNELKESKLRKK